MKDTYHLLDVGVCSIGITYGLENVETTLGIILLLINIIQIFIKLCVKLHNIYTRKEHPQKVITALGSAEDEIKDVLEEIKEDKEAIENGRTNE